jgi:hypothetical protein
MLYDEVDNGKPGIMARLNRELVKDLSWGVWYADDFVDKRPEYVGSYSQCFAYVENACEFGCGDESLFVISTYSDLDSQADEWLALAERGDILDAMSDYCV